MRYITKKANTSNELEAHILDDDAGGYCVALYDTLLGFPSGKVVFVGDYDEALEAASLAVNQPRIVSDWDNTETFWQ